MKDSGIFPSRTEVEALRTAYRAGSGGPVNDEAFHFLVSKMVETKISYYLLRMCLDGLATVTIHDGELMVN